MQKHLRSHIFASLYIYIHAYGYAGELFSVPLCGGLES